MVSALLLTLLSGWPGDEMPLPVTVKGPEDLQFKAAAERQYLIFNLMVSGRLAYERGDWAQAADKFEALLKVPEVPASVDAAVRPLALMSRRHRCLLYPRPRSRRRWSRRAPLRSAQPR
jgi:hypothetical protein